MDYDFQADLDRLLEVTLAADENSDRKEEIAAEIHGRLQVAGLVEETLPPDDLAFKLAEQITTQTDGDRGYTYAPGSQEPPSQFYSSQPLQRKPLTEPSLLTAPPLSTQVSLPPERYTLDVRSFRREGHG